MYVLSEISTNHAHGTMIDLLEVVSEYLQLS